MKFGVHNYTHVNKPQSRKRKALLYWLLKINYFFKGETIWQKNDRYIENAPVLLKQDTDSAECSSIAVLYIKLNIVTHIIWR